MENEIVLAEVSRLLPQQDKEIIDWKKLVRICKDCFDERYNVFFDGRDDTTDTARSIYVRLGKVPVLGIQVIRDRVIISALDLFEDDFYRVFRICELVIPLRISSRQIVEGFLKNALKLRFVVEKIIVMSVGVKDEISLLPSDLTRLKNRHPGHPSGGPCATRVKNGSIVHPGHPVHL